MRTPFKSRPFRKLVKSLVESLVEGAEQAKESGLTPHMEVDLTLRGQYAWTDEDDLIVGGSAKGLVGSTPVNASLSASHASDSLEDSGEDLELHVNFLVSG